MAVDLRDGPRVDFGDLAQLDAKWLAATAVLADADSRGASYVDVRLPERPVAGPLPATKERARRENPRPRLELDGELETFLLHFLRVGGSARLGCTG